MQSRIKENPVGYTIIGSLFFSNGTVNGGREAGFVFNLSLDFRLL